MSRLITAVWVPGHPKTKGSLTFKGKHAEENVKGSSEWRALVTKVVREDIAARVGKLNVTREPSEPPIPAGWATSCPVFVRLVFFLDHPDPCGATIRAGDIDKLVRNILDALTDAGAYVDDNQVMSVEAVKVPSGGQPGRSGVAITVEELTDAEVTLAVGVINAVHAQGLKSRP